MRRDAVIVDIVSPDRKHAQGIKNGKAPIASYTLATLSAQMPRRLDDGREVVCRVWDEQSRGPYTKADATAVFMTYLTTGATRAELLSREIRERNPGVRIVHGGIHATSFPNKTLEYANIAVQGEVDVAFQSEILHAAVTTRESRVMRLGRVPATIHRPPADWSWMRRKDYILAPSFQTGVGCPFHCDFCSVTQVFGATMRSVDQACLEAELAILPQRRGLSRRLLGRTVLAVIDDNFLQGVQPGHVRHVINMAKMMFRAGFDWVTEVTVKTLINAQVKIDANPKAYGVNPGFDLIEFLAAHGCRGLFFGIESLLDRKHTGLVKSESEDKILQLVRKCQANGIGVLGAFVLGVAPDETEDNAKYILEWAIEKAKLDFAQFSINTPMPGCDLFIRAMIDGTIMTFDWELYDAEHCVISHPRLSASELERLHRFMNTEFYSYHSSFVRYDLAALASFSPGVWRRAFPVGMPANWLLHRANKSWNCRLDNAKPRKPVPDADEAVWADVRRAIGHDPSRPGDLFLMGQIDKMEHGVIGPRS